MKKGLSPIRGFGITDIQFDELQEWVRPDQERAMNERSKADERDTVGNRWSRTRQEIRMARQRRLIAILYGSAVPPGDMVEVQMETINGEAFIFYVNEDGSRFDIFRSGSSLLGLEYGTAVDVHGFTGEVVIHFNVGGRAFMEKGMLDAARAGVTATVKSFDELVQTAHDGELKAKTAERMIERMKAAVPSEGLPTAGSVAMNALDRNEIKKDLTQSIGRMLAPEPTSYLRPEVLAFAIGMEKKLRVNEYKEGWKNDDAMRLLRRVKDETHELGLALECGDSPGNIANEAFDVGNMAMMVADVSGGLPLPSQVDEFRRQLEDWKRDPHTRIIHGDACAQCDPGILNGPGRVFVDGSLHFAHTGPCPAAPIEHARLSAAASKAAMLLRQYEVHHLNKSGPDSEKAVINAKMAEELELAVLTVEPVRKPVFRPVMQTITEEGKGNCLEACLASLLGVDIDQVPAIDPNDIFRVLELDAWLLKEWDLRLMRISTCMAGHTAEGLRYIAGGPGPRGRGHAVVYDGDALLHDPHPEGGGILSIERVYVLMPALSRETSGLLPKENA